MNLGEKVIVSAVLVRRTRTLRGYAAEKTWQPRPMEPREGLYIGYRTLADGVRDAEDEVGYTFEPKRHFRAALVVFSDRTNPVLVPLDQIERAPDDNLWSVLGQDTLILLEDFKAGGQLHCTINIWDDMIARWQEVLHADEEVPHATT